MMDDYRKEIQVLSQCNHRNIIKHYSSFTHEKQLWIVMPYIQNGNLKDVLKYKGRKEMTEPIIAGVIRQLLSAVAYLHQ